MLSRRNSMLFLGEQSVASRKKFQKIAKTAPRKRVEQAHVAACVSRIAPTTGPEKANDQPRLILPMTPPLELVSGAIDFQVS
mmetsp:Transcript_3128/g.5915  ORF Transcript_3128/g.5915 Transcript_3128/m.5915 type:complete len:82 (-) Transcript_3128:247-492(-)